MYRHQVEACVQAGPALLASAESPYAALRQWIDHFVDFLVTKHGLAAVMRSDDAELSALHSYFLGQLVPVCDQLLRAASDQGEIRPNVGAFELMYAVGNLCVGSGTTGLYDARRMVGLLIEGLHDRDAVTGSGSTLRQ